MTQSGALCIYSAQKVIVHSNNANEDINTGIIIQGDNYHALSVLNYTHTNSIDVIYIDSPYNNGKRTWKYNNNYIDYIRITIIR